MSYFDADVRHGGTTIDLEIGGSVYVVPETETGPDPVALIQHRGPPGGKHPLMILTGPEAAKLTTRLTAATLDLGQNNTHLGLLHALRFAAQHTRAAFERYAEAGSPRDQAEALGELEDALNRLDFAAKRNRLMS